MASLIKIKRSEVSGNPAVLGAGELAYSALADNGSNGGDRLYIGMGTETSGNAVNHVVIGGKFFTDQIIAATADNTASTIVKRDASGNFVAGTITAALSGNASTATKWATARNLSLTGDATATLTGVDGSAAVSAAITLATVNSNIGNFGSTTTIPVITVNAKGLVTAVSTASISTTLNVAGSTGTGTIALATDTLTIAGGTGVASSYNNTTKTTTLSIGQAVGTTDNVTFNNVTVNGSLNSDDITAANISVAGNATITGNLTVQGTTTTINSTAVAVADVNITLAKDATTQAAANGAGLTVVGPTTPATFTYTSADDRWNLNKNLNVATVYGALSGNASTATKLATARTLSTTGDATWTTTFDGSANVTAAITLATVNSNVGAFGSGTTVPTVTVNAKGLVTAVSTTAIPTATTSVNGLASFDSTIFTVTGGLVTVATLDGGTY
jgi:hypothetical protein